NWPSLRLTTGTSPLSRRQRSYKEARQEQVRQLHELTSWMTRAREYRETRGKAADRVPRDLKLEALGPYVAGERPWLVNAASARDIRDAVEYFVDTHKQRIVL